MAAEVLLAMFFVLAVFINRSNLQPSAVYTDDVSPCDRSSIPGPSPEYPLVLFRGVNYSKCSSSSEDYVRARAGEYRIFAMNQPGQRMRSMMFNSMLVLPQTNVSWKSCCPSGNEWTAIIPEVENIPDLDGFITKHPSLGTSKGVWYNDWKYWDMSFFVTVRPWNPVLKYNCTPPCVAGQCGPALKCECPLGLTGRTCEREVRDNRIPTPEEPLVLFPDLNFKGEPVRHSPNVMAAFASNDRNAARMIYRSMRVHYSANFTLHWKDYRTSRRIVGTDIDDLEAYIKADDTISESIWFRYSPTIVGYYYVHV